MKEKLISFETAKLAKEKGFILHQGAMKMYKDEDGHLFSNIGPAYDILNHCSHAPTQSLLQRWLREKHNLHIYIDTTSSFGDIKSHVCKYKSLVKVPFQPFKWTTGKYYLGDTYEEVLEKALFEALKLVK